MNRNPRGPQRHIMIIKQLMYNFIECGYQNQKKSYPFSPPSGSSAVQSPMPHPPLMKRFRHIIPSTPPRRQLSIDQSVRIRTRFVRCRVYLLNDLSQNELVISPPAGLPTFDVWHSRMYSCKNAIEIVGQRICYLCPDYQNPWPLQPAS